MEIFAMEKVMKRAFLIPLLCIFAVPYSSAMEKKEEENIPMVETIQAQQNDAQDDFCPQGQLRYPKLTKGLLYTILFFSTLSGCVLEFWDWKKPTYSISAAPYNTTEFPSGCVGSPCCCPDQPISQCICCDEVNLLTDSSEQCESFLRASSCIKTVRCFDTDNVDYNLKLTTSSLFTRLATGLSGTFLGCLWRRQ